MCDIFVVMPDISENGRTVLCKNSDRPSFDCQPLACHGRKHFEKDSSLMLAYLTIPQADKRFATLGSSPYWCWGYEEGINEFGVAIGNEAVYTRDLTLYAEMEREGIGLPRGLLGMELIRLGLERGKTALNALLVMTSLIEQYGQWGSGVPMADTVTGAYHNSFMIADGKEAYLLETAGKRWAAKKITRSFAAISNELSIRTDITRKSPDLIEYACKMLWHREGEVFDFAKSYISKKNPRQLSHIRVQRARQLLAQAVSEHGRVSISWMKRILRDHYEGSFLEGPMFNPSSPDFLSLCMHDSPAKFTWGNTASSSLFVLPNDGNHLPIFWWAPGVPCCSIYIPFFVDAGTLPECVTLAGTYGKTLCAPSEVKEEDRYQKGSFWWEMRRLLNQINGDEDGSFYHQRHAQVRAVFDELENQWMQELDKVEARAVQMKKDGDISGMKEFLAGYSKQCLEKAAEAVEKAAESFEGAM